MNHLTPYLWASEEIKKNTNEIKGFKNNLRILYYHSFTTLKASDDETPWCSSFMCAAAENGGYDSTHSAAAKSWEAYGKEVTKKEAEKGDIVILNRFSKSNPNARHVSFLNKKIEEGDTKCQLLGGNQSDSVSIQSHYKISDIVTIRRFV